MAENAHLTDCGLPGIERIPYGLHAYHFYPDRDQLLEALVPYFLAGLYNSERCLWITAPPLPAPQALEAIERVWPGARHAAATGALRVLDFEAWYGAFKAGDRASVVGAWLEEEARALAEGYSGLRIAGNTSFLHPDDWPSFMDYEREVGARFQGRRIVALCSYAMAKCSAPQVMQVMRAHNCAFDRDESAWQVFSARE